MHKQMVDKSKSELREQRINKNPLAASATRKLFDLADKAKKEGVNG